ncbi:MAG: DUF4340 domain-containing protein [Bryobacteraceae bacterium]|jgi:hypothetical protein
MKPKGLFVAVALLAALGGAIWWSNKKQAAKPAASAAATVLSIPDDQFQDIQIKSLTGMAIDLRKANGAWTMTQPKPLAADQDAVSSLVSTLSSATADKKVEDKATDLHPYGLDIPTLDITITKKDGKTAELLVGDNTLDSSGAYAKLANEARVFTVSSATKTSLDKTPDDLRDKRLLTFDSDKLTRVELQAKGQTIEFGKNGQNEWQIVKPRPLRADSSQVSSLVDKLKDGKLDTTELEADAAKKFATAAKVGTATVTDAGGSQTLEIRKNKDNNYYAKSSAVEGIWKTASDTGQALEKGLDDFRNKKLFDFGFNDPTKIELKNATYAKSGDKWLAGAKTMDSESVQTLVDQLRDLSATKFADKGGGEEVFTATVTSSEGKRVEKVSISKQGTQYFAKRENEPSIYELDAKTVEGLQKAAGAVKEMAPELPKKK